MARTKNEVLAIRTTAEVKALLKLAAEREHRSAASMNEVLVLDYYDRNAIRGQDKPELQITKMTHCSREEVSGRNNPLTL